MRLEARIRGSLGVEARRVRLVGQSWEKLAPRLPHNAAMPRNR